MPPLSFMQVLLLRHAEATAVNEDHPMDMRGDLQHASSVVDVDVDDDDGGSCSPQQAQQTQLTPMCNALEPGVVTPQEVNEKVACRWMVEAMEWASFSEDFVLLTAVILSLGIGTIIIFFFRSPFILFSLCRHGKFRL